MYTRLISGYQYVNIGMEELPQQKASIDNLAPMKSLIDLSQRSSNDFDLFPEDYKMTTVFDDTVLVEYIDENPEGEVMRGGIVLPENVAPKAWRKAVVILVGAHVHQCSPGDIVIFPNDMGMSITNIEVVGYGKVNKGIFLSEGRLFGICVKKEDESESKQS